MSHDRVAFFSFGGGVYFRSHISIRLAVLLCYTQTIPVNKLRPVPVMWTVRRRESRDFFFNLFF